ncbi:universal stress protein [Natronorubrum sulfidifaciens]|uniref:UspA domain-containing protein n=1 Tax=Natronorubrum sulfidifaciens JCM 14089 TaxID=1230460 RepID=L9W3N1_9EURY|nr:universal stress protein [Natronorubrum sulfidifaciens]ELY44040.1 UspA domain-containing protein [Natronorubrum sulfidifaciens JCM 14089]
MTKHILVPLDGSESAWDALTYVFEHYDGERITVVHVVDPAEGIYAGSDGGYYDSTAFDRARERGETLCEQAKERLEDGEYASSTVLETVVETGRPSQTILRVADEHDVDQIVMGSHGRSGVSRLLLGSVAETVTRRAAVPVTIVR